LLEKLEARKPGNQKPEERKKNCIYKRKTRSQKLGSLETKSQKKELYLQKKN